MVETLKNFLVVEDSADDAALISRAFKSISGCDAFVCRNLSESKAYLSGAGMYRHRDRFPFPDGVICDMHVGNESAVDLLRWLKGCDAFRSLSVTVLTGTASTLECATAKTMGALEVLLKPVKYEDLRNMVNGIAAKLCNPATC